MKKFNKLFTTKTKVQLFGEYGFRNISEIHETRKWIKIKGLMGSFQRDHINAFTNKASVEMFPSVDDLYTTDQYGSVYQRGSECNMFVGKLNGRTLSQFVSDQN